MPNTAPWTTVVALAAVAAAGPLSGTALASPQPSASSLYAPSALVLTVAHGEDAATAAPARAVTLSCAPTATGTHPDPEAACAELRRAQGDFNALRADGEPLCTREYRPVVVTTQGVWQGRRVAFAHTFANDCVKRAGGSTVFGF